MPEGGRESLCTEMYKGGKSEPSHHHCERISSRRRRGGSFNLGVDHRGSEDRSFDTEKRTPR